MARAAQFKGKILLVVHENDEQIPKETTDAYANAFKSEAYVAKGFTHSLNDMGDEQIDQYNQKIVDWIKANNSSREL